MRHHWSNRPLAPLCGLLLCMAAASCGTDADDARESGDDRSAVESRNQASSGDIEVLGTISATVDGEDRTWYVVDGRSDSRRYASAMWMTWDEGERMLTIGGFDTESPPLDTFESALPAGRISFGEYEGSVMTIALAAPADGGSLRIDLGDGSGSTLGFMPVATTSQAGIYLVETGSLDVTDLVFQNGKAQLEGRFDGVFRTRDGDGPIRIEDGRFNVTSIPRDVELRR